MNIGDKVRIIGGTHFKKKAPAKWGILKSKTKTFSRIDLHDYVQSLERGDPLDEVIVKEIQVASKFLEKVEDMTIEMPTMDDLKVVSVLPKEEVKMEITETNVDPVQEDAQEFNADGFRVLIEEENAETWGDETDTPMTFAELDAENNRHKALVEKLQKEVALLNDELSGAIANHCPVRNRDAIENQKLRELLKCML
jgi:hypothetical protein